MDTAQDIIDRNMFVFTTYHQKNLEKTLNESGNAVYEELAANHVDNQYDKMTIDTHAMAEVKVIEDVMEKGTHVLSYSIIEPLWYELRRWYKSKDTFSLRECVHQRHLYLSCVYDTAESCHYAGLNPGPGSRERDRAPSYPLDCREH